MSWELNLCLVLYAIGFGGLGLAINKVIQRFVTGPYRVGHFPYRGVKLLQILYGLIKFSASKELLQHADMVMKVMKQLGVDGIGMI